MFFNFFQILLPQELRVFLGHIAALGGDGVDEALPLQLLVGPLGGDDADPQVLGQRTDRRQKIALPQLPREDGAADLAVELLVDRLRIGVADDEIHGVYPNCTYMVYTV